MSQVEYEKPPPGGFLFSEQTQVLRQMTDKQACEIDVARGSSK